MTVNVRQLLLVFCVITYRVTCHSKYLYLFDKSTEM